MHLPSFIACLLALSMATVSLGQSNWPAFRGPDATGSAPQADVPTDLCDPANRTWEAAPHGKGWSSPVIWGDQLWITTATEDGKKQYALCYDRHTGEKLHDILVFENAEPDYSHPTNSYASPTPAIEEGRVYVHYGTYGTACLDTQTGEKLWERRDLRCDHFRGPGSSPVIDENNLYVALDGFDVQYVVALDKQTGDTVWRRDRDIDYGTDNGDRMKAYSTGLLLEHQGRRQLVLPTSMATIAYDPATGDELWRVRHGGYNAAIRPVYRHGLVYIMAGEGPDKLVAVDPSGKGDVTLTHIRWRTGKGIPQKPGPVFLNDRMFLLDEAGVVSCLDAPTGKVIWQKRIGGNYRSSLVLAGDKIFAFSDVGQITVFAAKDEYEELASCQFPSGFQASGAVVDDSLYIRSVDGLYCYRKPQ